MEIGTAIKTLRSKKGYSQKEFAEKIGITGSSLSLIENNVSFPQKGTITKICEELNISTSYLLFFSLEEEDVPKEKRAIFKTMNKIIKDLLLDEAELIEE